MKGLQTSRVVVIDDNPTEADALMRGLARLGVGATYLTGVDPAEFGTQPLSGVRLVFLDLHLVEITGSPLSYTVGFLQQVLGDSVGETGIVCWTKHAEEFEEFKRILGERCASISPAFLLSLSKGDFRILESDPFACLREHLVARGVESSVDVSGTTSTATVPEGGQTQRMFSEADIQGAIADARNAHDQRPEPDVLALSTRIKELIAGQFAFQLIGEWEQFVHDATSSVTSLLAAVAEPSGGVPLLDVQAVVAKATAGRTCEDERAAVLHLLEGSSEVLLDYLYGPAGAGIEASVMTSAFLERVRARVPLTPTMRARLNKALLTADIAQGDHTLGTGNIYRADGWSAQECGTFPMDCAEAGIRGCLYEIWPSPNEIAEEAEQRRQWKVDVAALAPLCFPCLLELTPSCDHAQRKVIYSRLVGGVLMRRPDALGSLLTKHVVRDGDLCLPAGSRAFCRQLPYVTLARTHLPAGDYSLFVDARHHFSIPVAKLSHSAPFLRLRHEVVVDFAAWLAGHSARPGYLSVG